jgi:anti-sigma factor RsiW
MPHNCPVDAEEVAERYVMARLAGEDLGRFEQHLPTCSRCTELVRQGRAYIQAIKTAGQDPEFL